MGKRQKSEGGDNLVHKGPYEPAEYAESETQTRYRKQDHKNDNKSTINSDNNTENTDSNLPKKRKIKIEKEHTNDVDSKRDNKIWKRKKHVGKEESYITGDNRAMTKDISVTKQKHKSEKLTEERKEARRKKKKESKLKKKTEKQRYLENDKEDNPEPPPDTLQLGLDYLSQWKSDRSNWKFQKVRQVWLLHNMYDAKKLKEEDFETLLLYLDGLKGRSREITQKQAQDILTLAEDSDDETKEVPQEKVTRARQIIQLLS